MKYLYYPGCTLHDKARSFDASGRAAALALGVELQEMPSWTCCGTTFPLSTRKLAGVLAPARTLVQARGLGHDALLTLCSFCYHVLKRTDHALRNDAELARRIDAYLGDEHERQGLEYQPYGGPDAENGLQVLHMLELLRDKLGFSTVEQAVRRPLTGLRVAPYYGCLLLRPQAELGLDDAEHPTVLDDLLRALGCEVIDFPHKVECCGSYLGVSAPDTALDCSHDILQLAQRMGADALALACPLCAYNLDTRQRDMLGRYMGFRPMPVLYFTQLLALALGLGAQPCHFGQHHVDPAPLLGERLLF